MANDFIASVWMPLTVFADVVFELKRRGVTRGTQPSTSGLIRGVFEMVRNNLCPRGHFQDATTAIVFLQGEGYSMSQVTNHKRNSAIHTTLAKESFLLERYPGALPIAVSPEEAEAYQKQTEANAKASDEDWAQAVLKNLLEGTTSEEIARKRLQEIGLTLEEAQTLYQATEAVAGASPTPTSPTPVVPNTPVVPSATPDANELERSDSERSKTQEG